MRSETARPDFGVRAARSSEQILGIVVAILIAVGVIGVWNQPSPGTDFVIKPNVELGLADIYATPVVGQPSVYAVRAGTQLRIDCVKSLKSNYSFGHISEGRERNYWVDITVLVLPNGDSALPALAKLPELDICQ